MVLQFKTICLLVCLKNGLIIQNHLLALLIMVFQFKTICLLNSLLAFQIWLNKSKPFIYLLFTYGLNLKPFTCLLNSLLALKIWFYNSKPLNTSVKQFIIIIH